ncbi:MAG: hypothetical protein HQL20_01475 [Candidatus Omnitrophica bacterium]|nr:hypothetical protein [Candidatus Omnitrophota bacterium]
MRFQFWHEGFVFIGMFLVMVGVPCFFTAMLGTRLIENLGQHPSRSAKMQMGICVQFLLVEIFAFAMLLLFFHVFSD